MSTVERVQEAVMAQLLRGEMAPVTWLRQDELAEQLGVSKIPVREALQRLAANGVLRFEANRGVVVPTLDAADAEEIYLLRRSIEVQLLDRALPHLTIVDLATAEHALDDHGTDANWRFHRALYAPSGWDRGLAIAQTLHAAVAPYVHLYTADLGGARSSDDQHRQMLEAARAGDRRQAVRTLKTHLDEACHSLMQYLSATTA